jgi:hypothetical protein
VHDEHLQSLELHVQVREPMPSGPQWTAQSTSAPDVHVPTVFAQVAKHVFAPPFTEASAQVASATQVSLAQQI